MLQQIKVFVIGITSDFIKTIEYQQSWVNKSITMSINGKKNVLFLRNLIRSGIRNVGDIMFVNGIPDADYIYQKLVCKENKYSEIMIVIEALRPYITTSFGTISPNRYKY